MHFRSCFFAFLLAAGVASGAVARADEDTTSRAVAVMDAHIRTLHDRLRITDAQQPQWDALALAMMANARHMAALHAQFANDPQSAPDDLRRYAAITEAHAEDVQRIVAPFDQLYAVMSPDQRKTADETFRQFERERLHRAGL